MISGTGIAIIVTIATGSTFVLNEWSHGGTGGMMGLGHRHMLDYGSYHCAGHDDARHGAHHVEHMHANGPGENATHPHTHCPGGAAMHGDGMGGRMEGRAT